MLQQLKQALDANQIAQIIRVGVRNVSQAFLILVVCVIGAYGQNPHDLYGVVVDENHQAVEDALVTVIYDDSSIEERTVKSKIEGKYFVPFLDAGRYIIIVTKDGYQTSERLRFIFPLNLTRLDLPAIVIKSLAFVSTEKNFNKDRQSRHKKLKKKGNKMIDSK